MALYRPYDGNTITYKQLSTGNKFMYIQYIWVTESNWYVYYTTSPGVDDATNKYVQISMKKIPSNDLPITPDEENKWAAACQKKGLPFSFKNYRYAKLKYIFENQKWRKSDKTSLSSPWLFWRDPLPTKLKCARLKL